MKRMLLALIITCLAVSDERAQFSRAKAPVFPGGAASESAPLFITGKVVMADGSPLPGSINIARICASDRRIVAYTDSRGYFSFQRGDNQPTVPDVSENLFGGAPDRSTSGCELRAELPGYSSDFIDLNGHMTLFDSSNAGTIVLHRLANVEGLSVSVTSLSAPPQARKFYIKGLQSAHKGNYSDAGKNLEKAVSAYPQYGNAWLDLAKVRMRMELIDPAREAFQKALDADNKLVEAHIGLGIVAVGAEQWPEAVKYLDNALRLDPVDFPRIWYADAIANYNAGNLDAAQKSLSQAQKVDTQHSNSGADRLFGMVRAVRAVRGE